MAKVFPFQPYRYSQTAGPLDSLVTQPYDKISPEMRARYLSLSPYNLVRIILNERQPSDTEWDNPYTRAAAHLNDWIAKGVLVRESEPALFAYFQTFTLPDEGRELVREGFIGLGVVEDYSAGIVHRHEQTLSGPKKDRLALLRHTHAHFGQIFMLYPDPAGEIDRLLDQTSHSAPLGDVRDEYGARHQIWKIADPEQIACIQRSMSTKKLLIADGHHRYETALAFRNENPQLAGAGKVMMTFVNMHSPGLKILATHRLVSGLAGFSLDGFLERAASEFRVRPVASVAELHAIWRERPGATVIGTAVGDRLFALEFQGAPGQLDVRVLHERLLGGVLGIGEEAVREERNLHYIRGIEAACDAARKGSAQIAFLLQPTSIEQVADISFGGGVMPQKSTDFYPKLLSGLTIYRIDE